MSIITINNLYKKYKDTVALNDVSLEINEGEMFGLLGVNGAGKTTLIKILSGLSKKTSGEVKIDNFDIEKDMSKIKEIINISPQETSVANNLTVKENLEFFAKIYGSKNDNNLSHIINTFQLNEVLNKQAKKLSGGYKRRLSIAISLVSNPKILFLDEPTLGLDILARRELWKILQQLKNKVTIVLTSHYLEEIEALCDRVAILSKGKLLTLGTVDELKSKTNSSTFENAFISIVEGQNEQK